MRLLIRRYRESPELGWSDFQPLDQPHSDVLAHLCAQDDRRLVAVHNLANEGRAVSFALDDCPEGTVLADLLEDGWSTQAGAGGRVELTLDGYGYRWLRVLAAGDRRLP